MIVTSAPETQHRVLLQNIRWETYEALLKDFEEQPTVRLTYDRGLLEIMTPLDPHEGNKKIIGRFVETLTEELEIEIRSLGSRTCRRRDLLRGLEPDQCYYITNESVVRGVRQIDLDRYPPPDLVIEIDITSSSIDRMALYITLGIPEVWRYDGNAIAFYRLQNGQYQTCETSVIFPFVRSEDILQFLNRSGTMGENRLIRSFREWVRERSQGF
ncbi:MAG: Uma2 family endonuclease [Cyanobacteria bacterium SBLK]|nr:Uma2 family endonuclease [Cyanobacteria bacterium SBLK]